MHRRRIEGAGRVYVTLEIHDPDGRRRFYRKYRSRSFVRNFLRAFWGSTCGPGVNVAQWAIIDDASVSVDATNGNFDQANLSPNAFTVGVGSGSTTPTVTDDDLETSLQEESTDSVVDDSSGDTIEYKWVTALLNSGASWSVNECAMKVVAQYGNASRTFLIIRDVLGSTVTVNNGQTITVSYSMQTTV